MDITERKLQEISGSLLITVPKPWAKSFHLHKGSKIQLTTTKNGTLSISPKLIEKEKKEETLINYDQYFIRNFFRQYFLGYEKITIKFDKKTKEQQMNVYQVLKRFMNVQVIEETENKIVVKSFRIEELSIRECLNRMHFLSLNIIDEVLSNNNQEILKEISENVTRFYYMLVMQVRRFVDEGRFTEQNQISLLHALDCRMVAEKIKRITESMESFSLLKNKKINELMKEIKKHYSKGYQYFYNNEYDKAIRLGNDEKRLKKEVREILEEAENHRNITNYKHVNTILTIIEYSRNISMLTR
jgi:phosphate uptake regulator